MPRKTRFTAEDVILAALELVREKGLPGLSAPAVANKMGCSTMPIYSHFKNMQALEDEVVKKIWGMVTEYQIKQYTGDVWIDQAIGWVRFARDEENLFKCMLDSHNLELQYEIRMRHWTYTAGLLKGYKGFDGLDEYQRERLRHSRAMLTHGVAMSPKLGMNKVIVENDEILSGYLASASQALLEGYKKIPPLEEKKKRVMREKLEEIKNHSQEWPQYYTDFVNYQLSDCSGGEED